MKISNIFFGCKLASVLNWKFSKKKYLHVKFDLSLNNLVQDKFFTQKIQKPQNMIFVNPITIFWFFC